MLPQPPPPVLGNQHPAFCVNGFASVGHCTGYVVLWPGTALTVREVRSPAPGHTAHECGNLQSAALGQRVCTEPQNDVSSMSHRVKLSHAGLSEHGFTFSGKEQGALSGSGGRQGGEPPEHQLSGEVRTSQPSLPSSLHS